MKKLSVVFPLPAISVCPVVSTSYVTPAPIIDHSTVGSPPNLMASGQAQILSGLTALGPGYSQLMEVPAQYFGLQGRELSRPLGLPGMTTYEGLLLHFSISQRSLFDRSG